MSVKSLLSAVVIAGCFVSVVQADTITCTNNVWASINDPAHWSNGEVPSSAHDYTVSGGRTITSGAANATSDVTFQGNSLLFDSCNFIFYHKAALIVPCGITVKTVTGSANFGWSADPDRPVNTCEIRGDVTMQPSGSWSATFRSNNQHILFSGKITGDSDSKFSFNSNEWSSWDTNNLAMFTGDLSGYYGTFRNYDGASGVETNGFSALVFGTTTCPGSVWANGAKKTFVGGATAADTFTVDTLKIDEYSGLLPMLDLGQSQCSRIVVTNSYVSGGSHTVAVRFKDRFTSVTHPEAKEYPLLTVPTKAGSLNAADYTLVPMGAGTYPDGALTLSVKNDGNGDPTLYLTVAGYTKMTSLKTDGTYGASSQSGFVTASHWNPEGVPTSGESYLVCNGKKLYTPYYAPASSSSSELPGPDITFGGDELVLGDADSVGKLYNQSYAHVKIPKMTIVNGLYYATGSWSGNRHSWLNTELTIRATDYEKAGFTMAATWQHIYLEGKLIGASDAKMYMENTQGTAMNMGIYSDCREYFGSVLVRSTYATLTPNFYLYTTEFPGTLVFGELNKGAGIAFIAPNGATIGGLEINRPTSIAASLNSTDWSTKPIVVTNSFVQNSTLSIALAIAGIDVIKRHDNLDGHLVPVLKVKKTAGTIDLTKVSLGTFTGLYTTPPDYFTPVVDDTDPEFYVLGLRTQPTRYLVWGDDNNLTDAQKQAHPEYAAYTKTQRTSFDEAWDVAKHGNNDGRIPGTAWNVDERPNLNYDYVVADGDLRTHSSIAHQYFQGRRLYLKAGITHQSNALTITNLYLIGGKINHAHDNAARDVYKDTPYSCITSTRSVFGNANVVYTSSFGIPDQGTTNCLRIGLNFSGSATLDLFRNNSSKTIGSFCDLCGDSSAFTGIFSLSSKAAETDTRRTWFLFHEQKNLGGEPAAFVQKGINLQTGVILQPFDSATISYQNRGILVNTLGSFGARAGESFTVDAQVTWMGQANKFGGGVLRFTKPPKFTSAENTAGTDAVIEGKNLLRVAAGSVGVQGNACACDGLQISFEGSGALNVKVNDADASDVRTLGLKNVKAATPFVLNAQGELPVVFDLPAENPRRSHTVALCTVTSAKAASLRGKFKLRAPKGYLATMAAETSSDGNVTFNAEIVPRGIVVIIR